MKLYKAIVFLSVCLTIFSCKKLIDIEETDFIDAEKALQTIENCEQGTVGAYSNMEGEGNIILNSVLTDEVRTEEFYNSQSIHEWFYGPDDIILTRSNFNVYGLMYNVIDRTNRVLSALPKAEAIRAGDEQLRSRLQGELLFIRAYCHFELFRWYCKNYDPAGTALPYMKEPSLQSQARIGMAEYFQNILADLNEAKPLVIDNLSDVTRANRMAVTGLQARIALYMREWNNAVTYSTEYINAIPLSPAAEFVKIWKDSSNNEIAFKLKRTNNINPGRLGSFYRGTSTTATNLGVVSWSPSWKLWNSFDQANDIRFTAYLKSEPLLTAQGRQPRIVHKYAGTGYNTTSENVADVKVFRTAEMVLIRAEAKAELNDLSGAVADLNTLRAARITGYVPVTFSTKDEVMAAVIDERFKEFAFEGHRLWDLKRRSLPVQRLSTDAPTASASTLTGGNFRFVIPIPFFEMQANRLMSQNDGY
jgi:hypothetical protein